MKNKILKTVMTIVLFIWCYSACALDSLSNIPLVVCAITTGILALFAYANRGKRYV